MTKSLVSVLIGTYNRSKLLKRCINSILNQNYSNIEIIIINDCSTDNTIEILNEYVHKYPNIKYINNNKNRGISYNSNLAYSLSSGKYIALIGDDDEWNDTKKITKQVEAFKKDKNLGIVTTYWNDVKNGKIIRQHQPKIDKNVLCQILKGNGIYCGSTALISKEAWEKVKGFDESVPRGTDSDLFRSIIAKGYQSKILNFFSTNVYIDNHPRMTPTKSISAFKKDILSNEICLEKFKLEFNHCLEAKLLRKKSLSKKYLKLFLRERNFKILNNFIKVLYK